MKLGLPFSFLKPFLIKGVKSYGCRNRCKSRFNTGIINRIGTIFCFCFWVIFWSFGFVPRVALGEFDATDSQNLNLLRGYVDNIEDNVFEIRQFYDSVDNLYLDHYKDDLFEIKSATSNIRTRLGYSSYDANVTVHSDLEHLSSDLDGIHDNITELKDGITELELLNDKVQSILDYLNSGSGGSGGSGDTEIEQDWLTEAKYTEIANQFLTSWGFEGGSGGNNFKQSFDMLVGTQTSLPTSYTLTYYTAERDGLEPFPDPKPNPPFNKNWWYTLNQHSMTFDLNEVGLLGMLNYNMQYMHLTLGGLSDALINNLKKQGWNDWQAHTNLVATIETITSFSDNEEMIDSTSAFGGIETDADGREVMTLSYGAEGSASQEYFDIQPAFTNDTSFVQSDVSVISNKLENIVSYSRYSNRYKKPKYIDTETKYQDYTSKTVIPNYVIEFAPDLGGRFVFDDTFRNIFNSAFTSERLSFLRSIFQKLWAILAVYCNFAIFKAFGKMGTA